MNFESAWTIESQSTTMAMWSSKLHPRLIARRFAYWLLMVSQVDRVVTVVAREHPVDILDVDARHVGPYLHDDAPAIFAHDDDIVEDLEGVHGVSGDVISHRDSLNVGEHAQRRRIHLEARKIAYRSSKIVL